MTEEKITLTLHKFDFIIKESEVHPTNGFDASWLTLKLSGDDLNCKIVNALRRVASVNVPAYAFAPELIAITANTTVAFNNDFMKLRLANLPVLGVDPNLSYLNEKYYDKVNYADTTREKHPNEKLVEVYLNAHNNSANVIPVTTNDWIMKVDGDEIKPYSEEYPMLSIELRPNDRFKCYMKAVLGVGDKNIIWSGARNAFYDQSDDGKSYEFTIEGNGQCSEYQLLIRACKYIIKKIQILKADLESKIAKKDILPEKTIHLKLDGEDHTMGELLNYEFQDHKDIISSGVAKPDHLIKSVVIKVTSTATVKSPLNAMIESIDIVSHKFEHIGKMLMNLSGSKSNNVQSSDKTEGKKPVKKQVKKPNAK